MLNRLSPTALLILALLLAACAPAPAAPLTPTIEPSATLEIAPSATVYVEPTLLPFDTPTPAMATVVPNTTEPTLPPIALAENGAPLAAGGSTHSCIGSQQGILCWGANDNGQLGDGTQTSSWVVPVTVKGLAGAVTALAAGSYHTCALISGEVWCWGKNDQGQLGDGSTQDHSMPVKVDGLSGALSISAGFSHTCALVAGGRVLCWGANPVGQIDKNAADLVLRPAEAYAAGGDARLVTAGTVFTCSLSIDNIARCWGDDSNGLLTGKPSAPMARVELKNLPPGATTLAARGYLLCALTASGEVWCRGSGWSPDTSPDAFVQVKGLPGAATQVAVGDGAMCALLVDGSVWCWGDNYFNQLETGDGINSADPLQIKRVDSPAMMVSSGGGHFLALLADGRVVGWGDTSFGAPGDGSARWK